MIFLGKQMTTVTTNLEAQYFGVVVNRITGKVKGVFNPDYDWQLAFHKFDVDVEELQIFSKRDFGVSLEKNSMTPANVAEIVSKIEGSIGKK